MLSADLLVQLAHQAGFTLAGVAHAFPLDTAPMERWLKAGDQGEMEWLRDTAAVRADPSRILRGAGTVLGLACCYATHAHRFQSPIAPYAQGRDYHAVVRDKLKALRRGLATSGISCPAVFTCDTFPIHEKAWAERCGLGWIGKSGLLVTENHGTRVVLATAIFADVPDRVATPIFSRCGHCHRCIDACPTHALHGDKTLDSRKCLAFHTVENSAPVLPDEVATHMGNRVFGCDACQAVCPWNRVDHACDDPKFTPREFADFSAEDWASIDDDTFLKVASGSALKRAGAEGIRRNARVALSGREVRVGNQRNEDDVSKGQN